MRYRIARLTLFGTIAYISEGSFDKWGHPAETHDRAAALIYAPDLAILTVERLRRFDPGAMWTLVKE